MTTKIEQLKAIADYHQNKMTRAYRLLTQLEWKASGLKEFLTEHEVLLYDAPLGAYTEDQFCVDGIGWTDWDRFDGHPDLWDFYTDERYIRKIAVPTRENIYKLEAVK